MVKAILVLFLQLLWLLCHKNATNNLV